MFSILEARIPNQPDVSQGSIPQRDKEKKEIDAAVADLYERMKPNSQVAPPQAGAFDVSLKLLAFRKIALADFGGAYTLADKINDGDTRNEIMQHITREAPDAALVEEVCMKMGLFETGREQGLERAVELRINSKEYLKAVETAEKTKKKYELLSSIVDKAKDPKVTEAVATKIFNFETSPEFSLYERLHEHYLKQGKPVHAKIVMRKIEETQKNKMEMGNACGNTCAKVTSFIGKAFFYAFLTSLSINGALNHESRCLRRY